MKKQDNKAADYSHVTPALIQSVEIVLNDVSKHRYSTSGIYNAHNAVFLLREVPESCTSCLVNRANNLKRWYAEYALEQANKGKDVYGAKLEDAAPTGEDEAPKVPNVSRETFTDLEGIYAHYTAAIVGAHTETTDEAEGEVAGINAILAQHGAEGDNTLFPNEVELLNARLDELTIGKSEDAGNTMQPITVLDKAGAEHKAVFTSADGVKGTLLNSEGKAMKPGTYTTEAGSYAVQPGGNVTFKPGEESIL